jgi:hypothetical protein
VPFGIVAIVYAAQVNGKITSGNHDAALKTAKSAKTWTWVAFACGLAFYMLYALAFALPQIIGASNR